MAELLETPLVESEVVSSYQRDTVPDGLRAYPTRNSFSWDRVFDVAKMYASGASTYDIAKALKMGRTQVQSYLAVHERVVSYDHKAQDQMLSLLTTSRQVMHTTWKLLKDTMESEKVDKRECAALIQAINACVTAQARLQGLGGDSPPAQEGSIITIIVKNEAGEILRRTEIGGPAKPSLPSFIDAEVKAQLIDSTSTPVEQPPDPSPPTPPSEN